MDYCKEHIIGVKTLKELPGVPVGTILKNPTKNYGPKGSYMPPEGIDSDGSYIPISSHKIFDLEWEIVKYPEFFEILHDNKCCRGHCKCKCCCHD